MSPWAILRKFGPVYLLRQAAGVRSDVGRRYPRVIRRALDEGHEVGVHGYDHYWWAEHVLSAERAALKRDMDQAFQAFRACTGRDAMAWASPNWRCSAASLALVDEYGFAYAADTRGRAPFIADAGAGPARAPQLPISLPCLHEIADYLDTTEAGPIVRDFASRVAPGYNVWCIHDYYEGVLRRDLFEPALDTLIRAGHAIVSMAALVRALDPAALPVCRVVNGRVPGGRGEVSCQGDEAPAPRAER